jgi:hypothetical protein
MKRLGKISLQGPGSLPASLPSPLLNYIHESMKQVVDFILFLTKTRNLDFSTGKETLLIVELLVHTQSSGN